MTTGLLCPQCFCQAGFKFKEADNVLWFACPCCLFKCYMKHYSAKVKESKAKKRLEYLRQEIRAERISYQELAELQSLAQYIDPGDIELLEPAGVPEFIN